MYMEISDYCSSHFITDINLYLIKDNVFTPLFLFNRKNLLKEYAYYYAQHNDFGINTLLFL